MRTLINTHKVNGLNEAIEIIAGEPGAGNAPTRYELHLAPPGRPVAVLTVLNFQSRPIQGPEHFDGLTNEALLAVLIDRMQGFQSGPFACRENALALTKLEEAQLWLHKRTQGRMARGVEGKLEP